MLTFKTWYDIERWFDWGYASVSTDGGVSWHALTGTQTSRDDPVKASYGPGYTGKSGGGADAVWVDEQISLARYAGQKVLLRFEFVTDAATYRQGWAIEDVAISGAPNAGDMSDRWQHGRLGDTRPAAGPDLCRPPHPQAERRGQ